MKTSIIILSLAFLSIGLTYNIKPADLAPIAEVKENTLGSIVKIHDHTTSLMFDHFIIHFDDIQTTQRKDTAKNSAEGMTEFELNSIGYIHSRKIEIGTQLTDVQMKMRYETSLMIRHEKEFCNLTDWKHYNSSWKVLDQLEANTFQASSYTVQEQEEFPDVKLKEILSAVEAKCTGLINNISTMTLLHDYPMKVYVSRYFLEISGKDNNGKIITRTFSLLRPSPGIGC